MKAQVGGERLEFTVSHAAELPELRDILAPLGVDEPVVNEQTRRLTIPVSGGADVLRAALARLEGTQLTIVDMGLRRPDLDDVFMTLTGHAAEQKPDPAQDEGTQSTKSQTREVLR